MASFTPWFLMSIRPPRVRMITFHSCHCLIYCQRFVQYRTSLCWASSSVSNQPYMRFLSVSASICVRLPSDSTSRWTPLSFANSSYCKACSGLSPPSYHPCRAHSKKDGFQKAHPPKICLLWCLFFWIVSLFNPTFQPCSRRYRRHLIQSLLY